MKGLKPARTNVASIIAAARKNLKKEKSVPKLEDSVEEKSENSTDDDSEQDEDDSDEESSDDDQVDDLQKVKGMQGDMLKDRNRKHEEKDEGSVSASDSEDEEAKKEAMKAASYFDSNKSESAPDVEVFAQLNLSRPLLRGVASIGFVSPTPIQSRVIPVALSGRDVCARYVKYIYHFNDSILLRKKLKSIFIQ